MIPLPPTIEKDDPRVPDSYAIKVVYNDRSEEEIEVVDHAILQTAFQQEESGPPKTVGPLAIPLLQMLTVKDVWRLIPFTIIRGIEFDRRWTDLHNLKEKRRNQ